MGGAAGFILELMLFIGFKYKLNMTVRLGHGNPLHLAYKVTAHTIWPSLAGRKGYR